MEYTPIKSGKMMLKKGNTIYTSLRHVSASGMSREISFYVVKRGKIERIDYLVMDILGYKWGKHEGVKISGAGMDMGYHAVSQLARALYGYISPELDSSTNCYGFNHKWI